MRAAKDILAFRNDLTFGCSYDLGEHISGPMVGLIADNVQFPVEDDVTDMWVTVEHPNRAFARVHTSQRFGKAFQL
jgi:hypothetical protein